MKMDSTAPLDSVILSEQVVELGWGRLAKSRRIGIPKESGDLRLVDHPRKILRAATQPIHPATALRMTGESAWQDTLTYFQSSES